MISSLLLSLAVSQAPATPAKPLAVVVASRRTGADTFAQTLSVQVQAALVAAGATGALSDAASLKLLKSSKVDPRSCQGATPCLRRVAEALGPDWLVVGVDVGRVARSLAVHLEAVSPGTTEPLVVIDFPASVDDFEGQARDPIAAFVKNVLPHAVPTTPPVPEPGLAVVDAPTVTPLEPAPVPEPGPTGAMEVHTSSRPSAARRALPWALAGGAVVSLGISGTFAVMGNNDKRLVDASMSTVNGMLVSSLPQDEFNAAVDRGNSRFTVALATAVLALALGAASAVLFATGEP